MDEAVEPDIEATLLSSFPHRGSRQRLSAVDVATGEDPFAVPRFDRATHEDDAIGGGADDRADSDLRIDVEHEAARRADKAGRFGRADRPSFQRCSASGAEPERMRIIVRMQI